MRKALSFTTLHNSFTNVGDAPVGIGEGVRWNSRFVRAIELFDTKERLTSNVVGVNKLNVREPKRPNKNINRKDNWDNSQTYGQKCDLIESSKPDGSGVQRVGSQRFNGLELIRNLDSVSNRSRASSGARWCHKSYWRIGSS